MPWCSIWRYTRNVKRGKSNITTYQVTPWPERSFELLIQCMGTNLFTHESTWAIWLWETNLLRFEAYILSYFLKDSRLSKTMKTARTVCATQCLISNIPAEHCRPCLILWPFMLAVLLEIFYRTAHKDTGNIAARRNVSNGESFFPVLNH